MRHMTHLRDKIFARVAVACQFLRRQFKWKLKQYFCLLLAVVKLKQRPLHAGQFIAHQNQEKCSRGSLTEKQIETYSYIISLGQ